MPTHPAPSSELPHLTEEEREALWSSREPSQAAGDATQRHTPGPWFRSGMRQKVGGDDTHSVCATVDGKEIIVASVWYNPITHDGFHDANLIAAAPDLLKAVRAYVRYMDDPDEGSHDIEETLQRDMRAAIAKASVQ